MADPLVRDSMDGLQLSQGVSFTELLQGFMNMGSQDDPSYQDLSYMELLTGNVAYKINSVDGPSEKSPPSAFSKCYEPDPSRHSETTPVFNHDVNAEVFTTPREENPWNIDIFSNIQLDEIVVDDVGGAVENGENIPLRPNGTFRYAGGDNKGESNQHEASTDCEADGEKEHETCPSPVKSDQARNAGVSGDAQNEDFITEDDIEAFLENEKKAAEEGNNYNIESQLKPRLRQQFNTKEESQEFFNFYSSVAGFSRVIVSHYRTISKKRNNEITRYTMKCHRYGRAGEVERENLVPQRQTTVLSRTNCKCEMVVTEKGGMWEITRLNLEHNHELMPNCKLFRAHKYMTDAEKDLIRTLKMTNNPTRKIVSILAYIRGGIAHLPYNKKAVSNYGTQINRELESTDMMEVVKIFNQKQAETPGFYYSFELDSENKVRSIFWTNQQPRISYEECGDCLSFDTTFLTNRYNLPFAPFVGVSTHAKTALFGCALIINETADTFAWLFEQFLQL